MMKAYTIDRYGKKELFQLSEVRAPDIEENEVLVEIHAAGLNVLDSKIKAGQFKLILPYKLPLILGHDVAGVVARVGSKIKNFEVGDEVYSRPRDFRIGTFAEYIAIRETDLAHKPRNLSMEEAASMPLVALTAWQTLVEKANIQKGQKVFIQAGSGGVGTIAIQLAKHLGAIVATTASEKSFEMLRSLGADVLLDYKKEDFQKVLRDYDLVLNSQDGNTLEKSLHVLKPGGTVISISGPPTQDFVMEANLPWYVSLFIGMLNAGIRRKAKKLKVGYSFLFMKSNGEQLEKLTELFEAGILRPVLDRVYPLDRINDAMSYLEGGHAKGKVVVSMK